jgi:hypothetical protein
VAYLHELTFPEIQAIKKQPIDDAEPILGTDGKVWNEIPDADIWLPWQKSVQHISRIDYTKIPAHVMEYFQATKGFDSLPPDDVITTLEVSPQRINVKVVKPGFHWAFSGINMYKLCPYKYGQIYYYKAVKDPPSKQCKDGFDTHDFLRNYLNREKLTPAQLENISPFKKYADKFLKLEDEGAELLVEKELAITKEYKPCEWFAPNAWARAKLDVGLIRMIDGKKRLDTFDWKTGAKKEELELQLKIFAFFGMVHIPDAEMFNAQFIWKEDKPTGFLAPVSRAQVRSEFYPEIMQEVNRMEEAWNSEKFPKQHNYLCNSYCPVKHCEHCGKKL